MSPMEAIQIIGLQPGLSHSDRAVDQAVTQAEIQAQNAVRFSATPQEQDGHIQRLQKIQEAANILRSRFGGGCVCIQGAMPGRTTAPKVRAPRPSRPRTFPKRRPSLAHQLHRLSAAGPRHLPSSATPRQVVGRLGRIMRDGLFVLWYILTWPIRLVLQRKLWKAAFMALLVAGVLWLCILLVAVGIVGLAARVRAATQSINRTPVSIIGRAKSHSTSRSERKALLYADLAPSMTVWLDGQRLSSADGALDKEVKGGTYEIQVKEAAKILYRTGLHIPPGADVRLRSLGSVRNPHIQLTVEVQGGESKP